MGKIIKCLTVISIFVALFFNLPEKSVEASGSLKSYLPGYYSQLQNFFGLTEDEPLIDLFEYIIQPGDTLFSIANKHGTDVETLVNLNKIRNPHSISSGEVIEVINATGVVHTVQSGETWEQIALNYRVDKDDIVGIEGARKDNLRSGERIVITGSRGSSMHWQGASPSFIWPVDGRITSRFGWRSNGFHYGLDVAAPTGTGVKAAAAGSVIYASYRGNYGLLVEIDHGVGWSTRYAHNSKVLVNVGQRVQQGEVISLVGATGDATGPHVHIEIIINGKRVDPLKYLPE